MRARHGTHVSPRAWEALGKVLEGLVGVWALPPAWEGAPRGSPAPLPGYLDAVLQAVAHRGAYLLVVAEQSGRNDGGAHRGAQGPARQSVLLGDPHPARGQDRTGHTRGRRGAPGTLPRGHGAGETPEHRASSAVRAATPT